MTGAGVLQRPDTPSSVLGETGPDPGSRPEAMPVLGSQTRTVKNLLEMQETRVPSLGQEDPP